MQPRLQQSTWQRTRSPRQFSLHPSNAAAQRWHFHGVTSFKFAEGRTQAGLEGCEGSIVRELAHPAPRKTLAVPERTNLTGSTDGQV